MKSVIVHIEQLDRPSSHPDELYELLSEEERARAAAFRFDHLRRRYATGRGLLRKLLAARTGESAGRLVFSSGKFGKPSLRDHPQLHFNLSHSGSLFACAISECGPLGVDIEAVREVRDIEALARRFFSSGESSRWLALAPQHREAAFFECWTRKEAFLKATGEGLSRSLDSFSVCFGPGATPAVIEIADAPGTEVTWQVRSFAPASGFVGAVAIQEPCASITFRPAKPASL